MNLSGLHGQYYLSIRSMSNLIISELNSTSLFENKKIKANLKTFISKTLENNQPSNPLLAPFVLMNMMLTDGKREKN